MRYFNSLSQMIEEASRKDEGYLGHCLNIILYKTLADRLWTPFKAVCFNPAITLGVLVVLYLVFCLIFIPLLLLSYLITSYGSFLVFCVIINYLVQLLARSMAFPGCNISVHKQIAADFINRILVYLTKLAKLTGDFAATLMLAESGRISTTELRSADRRLAEIGTVAASLPKLQETLKAASMFVEAKKITTVDEQAIISQLYSAVEAFNSALPDLSMIPLDSVSRNKQPAQNGANGQKLSQASQTAGRCLKASEALKAAAEAAMPPKKTGEEEGGIMAKLKGLMSINEGLQGVEKLTFPFMREQLKSRFMAESFQLTGCNNNIIDGIIISAANIGTPEQRNTRTLGRGLVMFCSPNGGFYECISQVDLSQSWLGYYTSLGYDICYYNYAGYGSSTGTPAPNSVRRDALTVAQHIKRTREPLSFIVHGESIGGMSACYIARHMTVSALVCDRTFASLDSVATRLLGGAWAGCGLMYLGLWVTNVVNDYLAAQCPKIILQDPDDEIIANCASLKNGIAANLVLGDRLWYAHKEPQEYILADHLDAPLPHGQQAGVWMEQAQNLALSLPEPFVAHLFACLMQLIKKAQSQTKPSSDRSMSMGEFRSPRSAAGDLNLPVGKVIGQISDGDDQSSDSTAATAKNRLTQALNSTAHTIDLINSTGGFKPAATGDGTRSDVESGLDVISLESPQKSSNANSSFSCSSDSSSRIQDSTDSSSVSSPAAVQKLWSLLARIDGRSGQLLGNSLRFGYDGFRSWVCALIVWNNHSSGDAMYNSRSLAASLADLEPFFEELSEDVVLGAAVKFIREGLMVLLCRMEAPLKMMSPAVSNAPVDAGDSSVQAVLEKTGRRFLGVCSEYVPHIPVNSKWAHDPRQSSAGSNSSEVGNNSNGGGGGVSPTLGYVIPLHCGHNGWPPREALAQLTKHFVEKSLA